MTTNLTHFEDAFKHIVKLGDTVLYHAEGRNPTVYKGVVKQILKGDSYYPLVILQVTTVASIIDNNRIATTTRKLKSNNIFALKE